MDVLTLTATPIPRTLHMAMTGLRDLSLIATPPADRLAIRTLISTAEDITLREGIGRELARQGQNLLCPCPAFESGSGRASLAEWLKRLRLLAPNCRVEAAHGQMRSNELEKTMVDFVAGDIDILVSTTIIESGLDIPRANTMFIADADKFGVSQLYQLRGRIGRAKVRAYCYLLVPPVGNLSSTARKRLEVVQRHSDLGSGFAIASHDLEIRGAGELLGAKQSGSIAAVGFDAYTQMLDEAVSELRGEEIFRARDPELNVERPGYISEEYVPDVGQRLDFYKRLAAADQDDDVSLLLDEMRDRYGSVPDETTQLGELMELKRRARAMRVQSIELSASKVAFAFFPEARLDNNKLAKFIQDNAGCVALTRDQRILISFGPDETDEPTKTAKHWLRKIADKTSEAKDSPGSG